MKAILVVDMPEKCKNCDLYREDKYADYICMATLEYVNGNEKPINCPLKPTPERKRKIKELSQYTKEYEAYCKGEVDGWNFCLDEILGEAE